MRRLLLLVIAVCVGLTSGGVLSAEEPCIEEISASDNFGQRTTTTASASDDFGQRITTQGSVSDDFESGNLVNWTAVTGIWSIVDESGNNVVDQASGDGGGSAPLLLNNLVSDVQSSFQVSCRIKRLSGGQNSLVFNYRDQSNFYRLTLDNYYGTERVALYRRTASGGESRLYIVNLSGPTGVYHELKVEREGSIIQVYVDGTRVFSVTAGSPYGGQVGLRTNSGTGRFDDFNYYSHSTLVEDVSSEWTATNGEWKVVDTGGGNMAVDQASGDGGGSAPLLLNNLMSDVQSSFQVSCRMRLLSSGSGGVISMVFNYRDQSNFYRFSMYSYYGTEQVALYRRTASGGESRLYIFSLPGPTGEYHELKVEREGSLIQIFVDGTRVSSVTAGSPYGGQVGLRTNSGTGRFDDFNYYSYSTLVEDVSSAWTATNGDWIVIDDGDGNMAVDQASTDGSGNAPLLLNNLVSDLQSSFTSSCRMRLLFGGEISIVFNYRDQSNFYRLSMYSHYGTENVALYRRTEGAPESRLFTVVLPGPTGEYHELEVERNGSVIQVNIDNDPPFSFTGGSPYGGQVGLRTDYGQGRFDDFHYVDTVSDISDNFGQRYPCHENQPPVADAGMDQAVYVGETVHLDEIFPAISYASSAGQ